MDTLLSSYCLTSGCDSLFFRDYNILVLLRSRPPAFPCALHAPVLPGKPTSSKHSCKEPGFLVLSVEGCLRTRLSTPVTSLARMHAAAFPRARDRMERHQYTDALGRPENLGLGLGLGLLGRPESAATGDLRVPRLVWGRPESSEVYPRNGVIFVTDGVPYDRG